MADALMLRPSEVRYRVDPSFAPAAKVARKLHLTESQFRECEVRLYARGFPRPDPDTGMYHLEAIDRWAKRQRPDLFPELGFDGQTAPQGDLPSPAKDLGKLAREGHERRQAKLERLSIERRERRDRLEQERLRKRESRAKRDVK